MKNKFNKKLIALFVLLGLLIASCTPKTNMYIRFSNQYSKDVTEVFVGPDNFGTVTVGQVTSYMSIPDGSGNISGVTTDLSQKLTGQYTISGTGTHHWTAVLSSAGTLSLTQDN